ncbi:MAG: dihydrolipoyl dehydrogenase [Deltaproteobacteria bacterium CG11_big_fil_rev_8_21_14_0_20_47_16]|nr:MAG: dihydrolipoyl dehydrogenase [Deltaproteobacteria bacterium CG11_big_fil_rev_8_21_14_0_20_47_16]
MSYDLVVVGGGPGGYVAAIRAAQLGAKVALIEKQFVGGTCLNTGCIPTKAMASAAARLEAVKTSAQMGVVGVGTPQIDYPQVHQRKTKLVGAIRGNVQQLLKGNGIEVISGEGKFTSPTTVDVNGTTVEGKSVIVATGSTWRTLPSIPMDGTRVISSDEVLAWDKLPESIIFVGGGVIGCEFASIFSSFGVKVTIVEAGATLLPNEDQQIGRALQRSLSKRGVDAQLGTTVESTSVTDAGVTCTLSNGQTLSAAYVVVAIGRAPNTANLGLAELGVLNDRGAVEVDAKMQTKKPGLYAIGDCCAKMMLAHVASAEGVIVAENLFGGTSREMDYHAVPRPIFTHPEICAVGPTAEQLNAQGTTFHTGKYAFAAIPKALCDGDTEGQLIVYTDTDNRLIAAHMIGAHATDLLQPLVAAVQQKQTAAQFTETIFSHPTLSEIDKEAVEDAEGRAIHKVYAKR